MTLLTTVCYYPSKINVSCMLSVWDKEGFMERAIELVNEMDIEELSEFLSFLLEIDDSI